MMLSLKTEVGKLAAVPIARRRQDSYLSLPEGIKRSSSGIRRFFPRDA
jgi:hypothetical protein